MHILLPADLEEYVAGKLRQGPYLAASEVVQEALLLMRERDEGSERKLDALRCEIQIGLDEADRGDLEPLDMEAIIAEGERILLEEKQAAERRTA